MSVGMCWWHQGAAGDVELVAVIERGSGPAAGLHICLPCAREVARGRGGYGPAASDALTVLDQRATAGHTPSGREQGRAAPRQPPPGRASP